MTGATHEHTGAGAAGDRAMTAPVPVLVITGPVGVGKSTIAAEAAWLLRQADVPHALVDLDRIEQCWPVPADDPGNERVSHRNLACMWANFRQRRRGPAHLRARAPEPAAAGDQGGAGRPDHRGPAPGTPCGAA